MTSPTIKLPIALLVTIVLLGLPGCVQPQAEMQAKPPPPNLRVAVLLPLTGPNAMLGRDLQQAVQLALGPDGPQPDIRDTAGTPTGATAAAQAAINAGDVMIVGPLTQGETAAAAAVAGGTPILAFTSDRQQGRPGVWPLGITPQQQVARLMPALSAAGRTRIAAVLPDNIFGNALADGLGRAAAELGDPPPMVKRYPTGRAAALDMALQDASDYANRHPADPAPDAADANPAEPMPPPPFDALLLAESGPLLRGLAARLTVYGVAPPGVQVIGPATWARDAANLVGQDGAWYAAPDPAARAGFEQAYAARYGAPPPGLADIAYDAAQLARVAAGNPSVLTRPAGFSGVDGPLALRPDGQVRRGLAVFAVGPGGAHIVDPAPASVGPGS